ncbi:hypothetical protein A8C56_01445 [Niabella ginsenosidivorans]|uniref:Uncharacterized protein n=1 Tax=Niabella ginsenosidivorans TaxID=1176587 RepID=A0A1A9HZR8_9BACT|nr:hypothetical protein A8C56_01445 [Niabella ginsenosidivorans]
MRPSANLWESLNCRPGNNFVKICLQNTLMVLFFCIVYESPRGIYLVYIFVESLQYAECADSSIFLRYLRSGTAENKYLERLRKTLSIY